MNANANNNADRIAALKREREGLKTLADMAKTGKQLRQVFDRVNAIDAEIKALQG